VISLPNTGEDDLKKKQKKRSDYSHAALFKMFMDGFRAFMSSSIRNAIGCFPCVQVSLMRSCVAKADGAWWHLPLKVSAIRLGDQRHLA